MDVTRPSETDAQPAEPIVEPLAQPLAVRKRPALARATGAGALAVRAARRAVVGLIRREPASMVAVGFGAGLVARAALAAMVTPRPDQRPIIAHPLADPDLKAIRIETVTVKTIKLLRK